jgi:hypothetical protein
MGREDGNAFLVFSGDKKSFYLTCHHNFEDIDVGETVELRLPNGDKHPIKTCHEDRDRDLLLFSIDVVTGHKCVSFSIDKVKRNDKVAIVAYSSPTLMLDNKKKKLVKEDSVNPYRKNRVSVIYN